MQRSLESLLSGAFQMYKRNWAALLITASILFIPGAIVKTLAIGLIQAPSAITAGTIAGRTEEIKDRTAELQKAIQAAAADPKDPKKQQRLAEARAKQLSAITDTTRAAGGLFAGTVGVILFGLFAAMVTAFLMYGLILPITTGAIAVTVGDRLLGGSAGPGQAYKLVFRRLGLLLSALIPGSLLTILGLAFCLVPGVVIGFFFTFVSEVVLFEGIGGIAALKRSVELVKSDWVRVLVILIVFGVINLVAHFFAAIFIAATSSFFFNGLVGDVITVLLLPFPIIGSVLLYFDVRKRREGLDDGGLRTGFAALQG